MTLHQLLLIVRARYRLILSMILITVVAAMVLCMVLPPRFVASTTLVIDSKGIDPVTGALLPVQLISSNMATELDIVQSRAVALKVVRMLKLADNPDTKQNFMDSMDGVGSIEEWLAGGMLRRLDVKPSRESRLIDITFTHNNPEFSAIAANAFAAAYIQTSLDMKVAPARGSATWFDTQLKQLREQLENAQARLSKYQTDKGITSTDQKMDVDSAKLAEISSQLVQVQAQAYENASRQKQLEEFSSKNRSVDSLPEVLSSPVIQELKARLSIAETRLNQASNTLGVNHPEYQRAQSEVTSVRKKLADEVSTAAAVIGNNLRIIKARERELQDALAAQKARLLDLNRHRDELGVLMKEVDNAQRAYETASQRHAETSLESRVDQSTIVVLNPAVAPTQPAFPKRPLIAALAAVLGAFLGIGFALAVEMLDRRIRGAEDLADAVGVRVWGVLDDTTSLSKGVERQRRIYLKRSRTLTPMQEPSMGKS